jgi:hypothetical protein
MVRRLTQVRLYSSSTQALLKALLRHAQALLRDAHPQLRLKQQLLRRLNGTGEDKIRVRLSWY